MTLNDVEAAKFLNISVSCLRNWRCQRKGPPYVKIGKRVLYRVEDLNSFLAHHRIEPEAVRKGSK